MRRAFAASAAIIAVMAGFSAYGFLAIEQGTMIATHWGLSGVADGFTPRNLALVGMPLLGVFVSAVCAAAPYLEPRREHGAQSRGLLYAGWMGSLLLLAAMHAGIVLAGAGDIGRDAPLVILSYALPVLLIALGNYTAKTRSNFFLGVRTPWTLSSEHAWTVANRTAGWAFALTGAAGLAAAVFFGPVAGLTTSAAGALSAAIVSVIASFFAWKNDPERSDA